MSKFRTAKRWLILFLTPFLLTQQTNAEEIIGYVVSVLDGDTVDISTVDGELRLRLAGIDAPEMSQPYGQDARIFLHSQLYGQVVQADVVKKDRYDRVIAKLLIDNVDQNLRVIEAGLAWWYEDYKADQSLLDQRRYAAAHKKAMEDKIGLWADGDAIDPHLWRRGKRSKSNDASDGVCGKAANCGAMRSCEEAVFYLTQCGLRRLDGDQDGVPCEKLCKH